MSKKITCKYCGEELQENECDECYDCWERRVEEDEMDEELI